MTKIILSAALLVSIVAVASANPYDEVNEKVLKAFKETFSKAQDVVWHEYDNIYQANFRVENIQVRAQYDEDGALLRTIRYYSERELLPNIVASLKKRYSGKEIFGVTETTSGDEVKFLVTLKDNDNWYVVKSDVYGNLQQTEKFKRADK